MTTQDKANRISAALVQHRGEIGLPATAVVAINDFLAKASDATKARLFDILTVA